MSVEDVHARVREGMRSFEGVPNAELAQGLENQATILDVYVAKLAEAKAILEHGREKLTSEVGALIMLTQTSFEQGWSTTMEALEGTRNADGLEVRRRAFSANEYHHDVRSKVGTLSSVYPDLLSGTEELIAGGQESAAFIKEQIIEDQKSQAAEMKAMGEAAERFLGSS